VRGQQQETQEEDEEGLQQVLERPLLYRKQDFEKLQQEGWSLWHGTQLGQ
jgi:hypothetical protein